MLLPAFASVPARAEEGARPTSSRHGSCQGTVLVVDDEHDVRKLAARVLEQSGFSVLAAADGKEALRVFDRRADTIDVVLLDLTMPRMGGQETLAALRARAPQLKAVLMSGYDGDDVDSNALGASFLHKPFAPAELVATVRRAAIG